MSKFYDRMRAKLGVIERRLDALKDKHGNTVSIASARTWTGDFAEAAGELSPTEKAALHEKCSKNGCVCGPQESREARNTRLWAAARQRATARIAKEAERPHEERLRDAFGRLLGPGHHENEAAIAARGRGWYSGDVA